MDCIFGDESHDETRARVFAVAGVLGSEADWMAVEKEWLARTNGKIFHATDCDTDKGDYSDTGHQANKTLYKDLVGIVCRSRLLAHGAAIDLRAYQEFFPGTPRDISYYRCFRDVIIQCSKWAIMSVPRRSVKFTFDSRQDTNYNAGVLYDYMVNCSEWKNERDFEEISFSSSRKVGIQVVDLFARESMKHFDNMEGPVKRPTRSSMAALSEAKKINLNMFGREYFQDYKNKYHLLVEKTGMSKDLYRKWLKENNVHDSVSARHRYMIQTDPDYTGNK